MVRFLSRVLRPVAIAAALAALLVLSFAGPAAWAQDAQADLSLSKSAPATAAVDTDFNYILTVSNAGPNAAASVRMTDTLPGTLLFVSLSAPSGWACTTPTPGTNNAPVVCTKPSLAAGDGGVFSLTVHVPETETAGTTYNNTASVSSDTADPVSENNASTKVTVVTGGGGTSADLSMSKAGPANAAAGTDVTYTLTASNNGPDAATSVQVTDSLPAGLTFVSLAAPSGWSCSTPAPGSGGLVTCTKASVASGVQAVFTLTAHIPSGATPGITYTNTATISSTTSDPAPENDTASAGTVVSGGISADLSMSKSAPDFVTPNANITYTLTAANAGPDAAAAVQMTDTLPGNLTFVSLSSPAGWSCSTPAVGSGGTVSCANSSFASGAQGVFTLTAKVPNGTADGTLYHNTATISSTTPDPASENNTAVADTTVISGPDLTITKTHSGNPQQGQTGFAYTINVSNVGNSATTDTVTVTDIVPAGLTAATITGTGWICSGGATPTCTRSDALAAGTSYPQIVLTVNVDSNAPSSVTNTAILTGGGDVNDTNNTASDPTTVTTGPAPDLAIAKTHSGNASQGQIGFNYTITVSNVGAGTTSGTVTVSDTIPTGMTATAMSGNGWVCSFGSTSTCTRSDALAGASSYPAITLTVTVASTAPSSITNTATVSGGGETNTANDSASDPTTVTATPTADLTITKTHTGNPRQGQIGFTYTITVRNTGGAASSGAVTVTDVLPAGLTTTAIAGAGWACTVGPTSTCTRADALASGASYPAITLTVNVAPTASGTITNTATVSGGGDTNASNNTATDQATVQARPDPTKDPDVVALINAQIAEAERLANAQLTNFNDRLEHLHDDATSGDQQGIQIGAAYSDPCAGRMCCPPTCIPGVNQSSGSPIDAFAYAPGSRAAAAAARAAPKPTEPRRDFAFWSSGYVSFGNADPNAQSSSINFTTSGVSAGVDYRFAPHVFAGFGVGYGRDTTKIGTNGTRSNAQAYSVAVYGTIKPFSAFFLDGILGYGSLKFDSQRYVVLDDAFVFGNRTGSQMFSSLTAGYEYRQGRLLLAPYARVNATWLMLDSFTEIGGLGGALNYSSQTANFITSVLGLRGKYLFLTNWGAFAPRFRAEYHHDFGGTSDITLRYADSLTGPTFNLTTAPQQRDHMTLGLGADFIFSQQVKLGADYQRDIDTLGAQWHRFKLRLDGRY
jgi:uncharacterized repeat protein (TIGR01451 family)